MTVCQCDNVWWQTVPQLNTSNDEGSVSNSCSLPIQLMGQ